MTHGTSTISRVWNFYSKSVKIKKGNYILNVVVGIVLLIFRGGNKAYNQCSIRKIRNIFVHDVSEYAVKVIADRKDEMMKDMDDYLNMIRCQFRYRKGNL